MANFSSEIRRELLAPPRSRDEMLSELRALLLTGGTAGSRIVFTSEDERVAELFVTLMERAFGVAVRLTGASLDPRQKRDKITFSYEEENAAALSSEIFGVRDNVPCRIAFLRGAFLGGGSCTLPREGAKTGYHLEFVFPDEESAEEFCELLDALQLIGSVVMRGDRAVVYCKSREAIGDFLSVVQADGALKTLEQVSAAREASNNENRVGNCLAGNADKAAIASAAQTMAISELDQSGVLAELPEPLRAVGYARLCSPELSMGELAEKLNITKSCLAHRLRRLMRLAGR